MGIEPMFVVEYNKLNGEQQSVSSCAPHIAWTMGELDTYRVILHRVDPAGYDCKGCLEDIPTRPGVTIKLGTIKTGDTSGG